MAGAEPTSTPSSAPQHAKADKTASHPQIPLTNYPSSDGINLLLVLLVVVATGSGVAYGARRWRRSRPQTS